MSLTFFQSGLFAPRIKLHRVHQFTGGVAQCCSYTAGLPLSVSVGSFLKLYRVRSVHPLKTSLSVSPLQFGSRFLCVLAGKVSHVEWSRVVEW